MQADSFDMKPYYNEVTSVQEIVGDTHHSVILYCTAQHPIINYTPASFDESRDDRVQRYFLPNTTFASGVDTNCDCLQEKSDGIEILLLGTLTQKNVGDHTVMLMVTVAHGSDEQEDQTVD
jgi:hypothetical protein